MIYTVNEYSVEYQKTPFTDEECRNAHIRDLEKENTMLRSKLNEQK